MEFKIEAKVDVLDPAICGECKLFNVVNFPAELWNGASICAVENHFQCEHLNQCKYLRSIFTGKDHVRSVNTDAQKEHDFEDYLESIGYRGDTYFEHQHNNESRTSDGNSKAP